MEKIYDGYDSLIFDCLHESLIILDKHLKIICANRSFYDTFHVLPGETVGQLIYDLGNHQWDIPALRKLLEDILPKHKTFQKYEMKHDFPSIGKKIMLLNARQIEKLEIILLVIEDITARKNTEETLQKLEKDVQKELEARINKQTMRLQEINKSLYDKIQEFKKSEKKLKESEILYKTLVNTAPEAVTSSDLKGKITFVSPQTLSLHGYKKAEELLGRSAFDLIAPSERKAAMMNLQKTLRYGHSSNLEYRLLKKDGSGFFGEMHAAVIRDVSGAPKGFIATVRDITARRKTQEELIDRSIMLENTKKALLNMMEDLTEIKAQDEAVLSSLGEGMVAVEPDGRIMMINKQAEILLGVKKEKVIGKLYGSYWTVEDEDGNNVTGADRPIKLALQTRKTIASSDYVYVRGDKSKFPVSITAAPVMVAGKLIAVVEIFRDISHEKEIDKAKSEFVSLASHQLRTPLTAISWSAEILLSGEAGTLQPGQKQYLVDIYQGNRRMIDLVNSLLNVSRIELGTLDIRPETIWVTKIINNLLGEFTSLIENKKLKVAKHYKASLPGIKADPKLLRIILQNLLSNAINYSQEEGKVDISVRIENGQFVFTVADNGIGIPKKAQGKIFSKLYRADNAQIHVPNGTGLGLYIVRAAVEQSGGKIWFESKENKGSTFYFTLPAAGMKKQNGQKTLIA